VSFALQEAGTLPCAVRIAEITGGDFANPTVIAAAAANATWGAVGFQVGLHLTARIDKAVSNALAMDARTVVAF
jgi:hypothetical protein